MRQKIVAELVLNRTLTVTSSRLGEGRTEGMETLTARITPPPWEDLSCR